MLVINGWNKNFIVSGKNAISIFNAGCAAVQPDVLVPPFVEMQEEYFRIGKKKYYGSEINHVYMVAIGKAAPSMAYAVQRILGERITDALVISKDEHHQPGLQWPVFEAGHPVPDERSLTAGKLVTELADRCSRKDLLLVLISGGSSSLVSDLIGEMDLSALRKLSELLLHSGATIAEINSVRKHLSLLKGGQLARAAFPAAVHSLVLSDVLGDDLSVIASGPTFPDSSTFGDALAVIQKYNLRNLVTPGIISWLENGLAGHIQETPKPGDAIFEKVINQLIGTNEVAISAAAEAARKLGYEVSFINEMLSGESRQQAVEIITTVMKTKVSKPTCFIAGGETTVTIRGSGKGGRNQEFVLAAVASLLKEMPVSFPVILSGGTDGTDGPTDAAGAVADEDLFNRVKESGIDPESYLINNDAYHFFQQMNGLLVTGPTNTNVMDLLIIIKQPEGETKS
jgi:glycerate 2-kinase